MIRTAVCVIFLSAAALCQTQPAPPQFEVASVKPSATGDVGQVDIGIHIDGAQVRCNYFSLKNYIGFAYRVKDYQVSGPEWMASERFDIAAKIPEGGTRDQVPEMLQTLLEERFGLKSHRESKEFPVYALQTSGNGTKLKPSAGDAAPAGPPPAVDVAASGNANGVSLNFGGGSSFSFGNGRLEGRKLTMIQLADTLSRFTDRPVVDATGLTDTYDIALDLSPEDYRAMLIRSAVSAGVNLPPATLRLMDAATLDSLFGSVESLGLKLVSSKAPLPVLVIDQANKTPAEN